RASAISACRSPRLRRFRRPTTTTRVMTPAKIAATTTMKATAARVSMTSSGSACRSASWGEDTAGARDSGAAPVRRDVRPGTPRPSLAGQARADDVVGVHDGVSVALLGQEPLPVRGVLGVDGVPRHHGVEARLAAVPLGAQD